MIENDAIINMAKALGRAIQLDPRYVELDRVRTQNDADAALQDAIGRFNLAKLNLNNALGETPPEEEKIKAYNAEMQRAYADIMGMDGMTRYQQAKAPVDAMATYVNAIITTAVNGGDPDIVEQPSACSGSCDSCGGCH